MIYALPATSFRAPAILPTAPFSTAPSNSAIARFESAWNQTASPLPEIMVGEGVKKVMMDWRAPYQGLLDNKLQLTDPAESMQFLQKLTAANIQLEITAKVVGSAGQTINRLVSMQ